MRETAFPRWQFALISLFLLGDALYLPAEPHALWLTLPAAGLVLAAVLRILCRVLKNTDVLGMRGLWGRIVAIFFALLAAYAALTEIGRLCEFWQRTSFRSLPMLVTALLLLAAGLRLARAGTVHLSMWALPTLIAVLTPLLLSILLTAQDWRLSELLPLPSVRVFAYESANSFLRYLLPAVFPFLLLFGREQPGSAACGGVVFASVILSCTAARNLLLLGAHTAANVAYPSFAAAGLVSVGDFFQRAEVLIAGVLTLCQLARLAILLLVIARGLRTAFQGLPLTKQSAARLPEE